VEVSNQARIRCSKRYCETDHIKNWHFKCSAHKGEKQYKETDDDSFLKALAWSLIAREDNKDNSNIKPVLIELNT